MRGRGRAARMSPAGVVFVIFLVCAAVGVVVHHSPHQRRKREQRALERQEAIERALAGQWMDAVAYHQKHSQNLGSEYARAGLAHVGLVYRSYPRRGTKAVLHWYGGDGAPQDTWFRLAWPRTGDWLLVSGGFGYGEHNHNPNTFYAYIVGVVPAGAFEAWQRQTSAGQLPVGHVQHG
jgi:hypothetical protein